MFVLYNCMILILFRAAMKMANIDAVFDFMFTTPKKVKVHITGRNKLISVSSCHACEITIWFLYRIYVEIIFSLSTTFWPTPHLFDYIDYT